MISRRKLTYEILDIGNKQHTLGKIVDIFLILLISLNVLFVILETLPAITALEHQWFYWFEVFSVIVFSIEYVARVWSCVEDEKIAHKHPVWGRLRYMLTPLALIDLIVILPFYLSMMLVVDLRFMRVLRLLRVFKLTRYSSSMSLLLQVLQREARSIGAALFVLFMLIIVASSLIYFAEHHAQPEAFSSIPAAMWWAIVTMTTLGYGDVIPITVMGKIMASIISIMSLGIVALPAGLLASGFSEAIRERRRTYEKMVNLALQDGEIDSIEHKALNQMRETLGISKEDAAHILHANIDRKMEQDVSRDLNQLRQEIDAVLHDRCPHCNHSVKWLERRGRSKERS
ncbi:ion transporter [Amphritea pacifica]|uniref:Ion transporter n=1 Tax=Amphritea pacifica TaxID=2811233 RepID=A0ABS2WAY3_9GAMM|nr:ion transporter [Amphritea pacifica]MBN0988878.1 ion transporter [Amphritea pacifica]MBN1006910.1 ion transporter [Amphritea pacifica]